MLEHPFSNHKIWLFTADAVIVVFHPYRLLFLCRLDQMFSDAFAHDHQLLKTDPKHGLYLACGLIVRGNVEMSDIRRNIDRCENCSLI